MLNQMKRSLLLTVLLSLSTTSFLFSQILFEKRYGLNNDNLEQAGGGVLAADGGLVLAGHRERTGDYEIFLQKLNPDGSEAWQKTLINPGMDVASGIIAAAGGGYLISGWTLNPDNGSMDALLLKTDTDGNLLWRKTFGGAATDFGLALCQLNGGSILLLGYTVSPANTPAHFRAVFDAAGNLLGSDLFPTTDDVAEIKAVPTADGGYAVAVQTGSFFTSTEVRIVKYDANLDELWSGPLSALSVFFGSMITGLLDFDAVGTGVLLCLETGTGAHLLQLQNSDATPLLVLPVYIGFNTGAAIQPYPDGTIGVVGYSAPFFFKKLSAAGTTLDSIGLAVLSFPGIFQDQQLVLNTDQAVYFFSNLGTDGSNTYAVNQVTLSGTPAVSWTQTFGSVTPYEDETGDAIAGTPDGGFVLAGTRPDSAGNADLWVLRANAAGAVLWEKTVGISSGTFDDAQVGSVKLDAGGNIIVLAASGFSDTEYHLLKFSATGDLLFDKIIAGSDYNSDFFRAYPLTGSGFIACITQLDFDAIPALYRMDESGNPIWMKTYDGDAVNDLTPLTNGNFLCAGSKDGAPWIFSVDASGNLLWEKTYPTAAYGTIQSLTQTSDGHIGAVGGAYNDDETAAEALVIKINETDGSLLWQKQFSKGDNTFWVGATALPAPMGGICFTGVYLEPPANADNLISLFRYRVSVSTVDATGQLRTDAGYGNDATHPLVLNADCTADGQNIIFCGVIDYGLASQDAWVVQVAGKTVSTLAGQLAGSGMLDIAPNPASGQTRLTVQSPDPGPVQIRVFDAAGREVANLQGEKQAENWAADLQLDGLPAGLYRVVYHTANSRGARQLVVQR